MRSFYSLILIFMYTATITSKQFTGGILSVVVMYSNGIEKIEETIKIPSVPSDTWPQDVVTDRIKQLTDLSTLYDEIKLTNMLPLAEVVEIPPVEQVPTEVEIYNKNLNRLYRLLESAKLEIIPVDDPSITALKEQLQKDYKPEFTSN